MVAQLPVTVEVPAVVAAELVGAGYVNDHMPVTTKIDILDEEVAATGLAAGLPHRRDVASLCDEASFMEIVCRASRVNSSRPLAGTREVREVSEEPRRRNIF